MYIFRVKESHNLSNFRQCSKVLYMTMRVMIATTLKLTMCLTNIILLNHNIPMQYILLLPLFY